MIKNARHFYTFRNKIKYYRHLVNGRTIFTRVFTRQRQCHLALTLPSKNYKEYGDLTFVHLANIEFSLVSDSHVNIIYVQYFLAAGPS